MKKPKMDGREAPNFETMFSFAYWLIDRNQLISPEDVVEYFEKPWHWSGEYQEYLTENCRG